MNQLITNVTGKALIQLAQAVAARDEVPITNGEMLWPMLKKINLLRNRFVHDLEPSRERVEALMREIVRGVLGTVSSDQLSRDFYYATKLLLGYLAIDRVPMGLSDTE